MRLTRIRSVEIFDSIVRGLTSSLSIGSSSLMVNLEFRPLNIIDVGDVGDDAAELMDFLSSSTVAASKALLLFTVVVTLASAVPSAVSCLSAGFCVK